MRALPTGPSPSEPTNAQEPDHWVPLTLGKHFPSLGVLTFLVQKMGWDGMISKILFSANCFANGLMLLALIIEVSRDHAVLKARLFQEEGNSHSFTLLVW